MTSTSLFTGMLDPLGATVLRLSLAALFLSSARHKARDRTAFRAAVAGYDLLPPAWVRATAQIAFGCELLIGVALLASSLYRVAAVAAVAVLAVYSSAIVIALRRGRSDIDCGCGGSAGRMPISRMLLARNAVLIGACLAAALPSSARPLGRIDVLIICVALPTFALLYAGAETAIANAARSIAPVAASGNGGDPEGAPRARRYDTAIATTRAVTV